MALTERVFRFPSNKRAERNDLKGQLNYVIDEAVEAAEAYRDCEGDHRIIEELWDTVQAAEGALRKFPRRKVVVGLARVKFKSLHRGDYGKTER